MCDEGEDLLVQPLLINHTNQDIHLINNQNRHVHKVVSQQINSQNILHHLDSNELNNKRSNLIEITVSPEEAEYMEPIMSGRTDN